jgi:hypothetical protein
MRLRAGHVTIAAAVLITLFVIVAVWQGSSSGPGGGEVVDGALPPVDGAQDQVASMAVDATEVDLGIIPNTEEGHGKLVVHNRGKGPLKISEVRSSCACTAGAFAPGALPIPPGASAELNIRVDPKRIYGFESKKTLTLFSNDPVRPSLDVVVSAKIDPEFSLEPDKFDFGTVAKGVAAVKEMRLVARIDTPFKVTGVSTVQPDSKEQPPTGLQLELVAVPEAEWKSPGRLECIIRASIGAEMPPGPFDMGAFISTDLKRFRFLRIPVHGMVEAPYKLEMPSSLRTVVLQPNMADARVKVTAEVPLVLESAAAESGTVTVSGSNISGGMELVFTAVSGLAAGRHDDRVRVRLRAGDKSFDELFEVRVFAGAVSKTEQ